MRNGNENSLADLKVLRRLDYLVGILNMLECGAVITSNFTESITRTNDVSLTSLREIVREVNGGLDLGLIVGGLGDGVKGRLGFLGECADLTLELSENLLFLLCIGYAILAAKGFNGDL